MNDSDELRRKRRRKVIDRVEVVDAMTDMVVGHLGNLSENGMLLVATMPLVDDALYQLRFNLCSSRDRARAIEVGAHLLWQEGDRSQGHNWVGLRFITVLDHQLQQLREWLDAPGSRYQ
ncbi:MAG TPA: PilZ domain-containing protein [Lysobacter sp.]|nr:PilZ domain-containing protein [Lysobacter sp.]